MEVPEAMKERYLEHRRNDLKACLVSLEKKSFDEIEKVGHQLKGNAETFGHPELSTIGEHLEESARSQNLEKLKQSILELARWISRSH